MLMANTLGVWELLLYFSSVLDTLGRLKGEDPVLEQLWGLSIVSGLTTCGISQLFTSTSC